MNTPQKPAIILINPQMGENIGAAARVMHNFALDDLRIVAPRDGWPNDAATAMAANAKHLIEQAKLFDTVEDAIADCNTVYATTARERAMNKPVVELPMLRSDATKAYAPRGAHAQSSALGSHTDSTEQEWEQEAQTECLREPSARGAASHRVGQEAGAGDIKKTAILFGPERTGLINEHIALADAVLTVPTNPDYPSLNLAQAVGVTCYELYQNRSNAVPFESDNTPTNHAQLQHFFDQLESALDTANFWNVPEKKEAMMRNIRTSLQRAQPNEQELQTWHGMIKALVSFKRH